MKLIRLLVDWIDSDRHREGIAGLGGALERLRRVIRPGSLLFVLSDFYALDESSEHHLARLRQHNDVLACQIVDALELAPPPPGRYGISDGRQVRMLDTADEQLRARYSDYFRQHHARIHQLLRRRAVPLLSFATHDDIAETLRRHLAPRRRTA